MKTFVFNQTCQRQPWTLISHHRVFLAVAENIVLTQLITVLTFATMNASYSPTCASSSCKILALNFLFLIFNRGARFFLPSPVCTF